MAEIETLFTQQKTIAPWIRNFITNTRKSKAATAFTVFDYQSRLSLLESHWSNFQANHFLLVNQATELQERSYFKEALYERISEDYMNAKAELLKNIHDSSAQAMAGTSTDAPPRSAPAGAPVQSSLEKVKLPKFGGLQRDWQTFYDKFQALIISDTSMQPVIKLQHLLNSLEDDAADLLRSVKVSGDNFETAWEMLRKRYDDKLLRFNVQMEALANLPSATTESTSHINTLLSTTNESINVFRALKLPVQHWDSILVFFLESKLPPPTRFDWTRHREPENDAFATYANLRQFLEMRVRTIDRAHSVSSTGELGATPEHRQNYGKKSPTDNGSRQKGRKTAALATVAKFSGNKSPTKCTYCADKHFVGFCKSFAGLSLGERRAHVSSARLCFNCLSAQHLAEACTSTHRCMVCQAKHHTKLHSDSPTTSPARPALSSARDADCSPEKTSSLAAITGTAKVLSTALVVLVSTSGGRVCARALLDSCSEESYVSEAVVETLNLRKNPTHVAITGLGGATSVARSWVQLELQSETDHRFGLQFKALTLSKLTARVPRTAIESQAWAHLNGLKLADPGYDAPGRVDCLLGAEVFGSVLRSGFVRGPEGAPSAICTVFGWVLMGGAQQTPSTDSEASANLCLIIDQGLTEALTRFWELEEPPAANHFSPEEEACYANFCASVKRDGHGRFLTKLPLIDLPVLSGTREAAAACLRRIEKKFRAQPELQILYRQFMAEYLRLGHMTPIPSEETPSKSVYLPHHPVVKEDQKKIRVVFNAAHKDLEGRSLNDFLHPGPNLLEDIRVVLMRWRTHRLVFSCDIVKMFRQFLVYPEDRDWQRILWRDSPDGPLQDFRLNTVTYGTACAPFLANACLLELAKQEENRYPLGAHIIRLNRYADDFFVGSDSEAELMEQAEQLMSILGSAGMSVSKWACHPTDFRCRFSNETTEEGSSVICGPTVSTLGMLWDQSGDHFSFKITAPPVNAPITKRQILSDIAKLYDPLGFLSPFIVRAKLLLQNLWLLGVGWDDPLTHLAEETWCEFRRDLPSIGDIKVPRWTHQQSASNWVLHGFCDASEKAYAAVVYAVVGDAADKHVSLLIGKSKVAPLKIVSIPRLELCGAVLLTQLAKFVLEQVQPPPLQVYCWTDSRIVLAWLRSHPARWKTFTANRVSQVHTLLPHASWRHVPSSSNPADCASRGCNAAQLASSTLWWRGPSWLTAPLQAWPPMPADNWSTEEEARRSTACFAATADMEAWTQWFSRFSAFQKIVRILSYVARWKASALKTTKEQSRAWLSAQELAMGRTYLWRLVQREAYSEDIVELQSRGEVRASSTLRRLAPFLDTERVIRVGGRLQNAALHESEKHPIILPAKHQVTRLLILDTHRQTLHGGPLVIQSVLSRYIWIVRGRSAIRGLVCRCVTCLRHQGRTMEQQMGPIPAVRTRPARPFTFTGVDYAGPLWVKASPGRGHKAFKGYLSIFVCLVTKASHIEVVSDYSSSTFLAAFRRFVARRGLCKRVYSDQGTTFRGAESELRLMFEKTSALSQEVAAAVAQDGVEWVYIPPNAPNFGGLWEATVKSFKRHTKRVLGETRLTFEEMCTLASQIEACLNSRPISTLYDEEEDVVALTPGHFLIGAALVSPPEPFEEINDAQSLSSRWKLIVQMRNHFWARWSQEYLANLQQRSKWLRPSTNLQVNDVVLVKNELQPPTKWLMGRVTQVFLGSDGLCRVAQLRTTHGSLRRPVNKLVYLPTTSDLDQAMLRGAKDQGSQSTE